MVAERSDAHGSEELLGRRLARGLVGPVVVAVVAYALLLLYGDAPVVLQSLQKVPLSSVLQALGLAVVSLALRGLRWHLFLRVAKVVVPASDSALIFCAGLGMSITPGKFGEVLKSLLLKERHDVPFSRSAPVIVAERLMDLVTLVLLGGLSLGALHHPLLSGAAGVLVLAAFFAFGSAERVGVLAVRAACIVPLLRRHREALLAAHASLRSLWQLPSFSLGMLLSFGSWGLQALTVSVFARAVAGALLSPVDAFLCYAAPLLAGTLALIPGGLGLTEASMTGTLQAVSTISLSASVGVTILTRAATFWVAILIGFCALAVWRVVRPAPVLRPGDTPGE